jgi:hypothetical protein
VEIWCWVSPPQHYLLLNLGNLLWRAILYTIVSTYLRSVATPSYSWQQKYLHILADIPWEICGKQSWLRTWFERKWVQF